MKDHQYILLSVKIFKENEQWGALCEQIGVGTYGETAEEVVSEIEELVNQHLKAILQNGSLEKYLKDNNIKVYSKPQIPKTLDVPTNPDVMYKSYVQKLQFA
jgi:predicted RNase H-like HicB family nuclease